MYGAIRYLGRSGRCQCVNFRRGNISEGRTESQPTDSFCSASVCFIDIRLPPQRDSVGNCEYHVLALSLSPFPLARGKERGIVASAFPKAVVPAHLAGLRAQVMSFACR